MEIVFLIIGYLFFQYDIALLKKRSQAVFQEVFCFSPRRTWMISFLLFLAVLKTMSSTGLESAVDIFVIVLGVLVFVYLLRRAQFFVSLKRLESSAVTSDEHLRLALSVLPILCWWALGMVLAAVFWEIIKAVIPSPVEELAGILIFYEISVFLFLVLIYRAVRSCPGLKLFETLSLQTRGLNFFQIWVFPVVFALVYAGVTSWILDSRPVEPLTPLQDVLDSTRSVGLLLFFVATAILTTPFFEEIIFRGFLFSLIQRFKGNVFAVVFVALVFGALHADQYWGDWGAILVVSLLGLFLTLFRVWSGSAVPGMIAHYVYNTTLMVVPVIAILFSNPLYLDYQVNYYRLTTAQKEERLLKSIERYPKFTTAYNDLAWLYSEEGIKLTDALDLIDQALVLEPENPAFWDTKAQVLFKMGRKQEAIEIEKRLVVKYPGNLFFSGQLQKFSDSGQ